jgi:stage II sporulation protein D
MAALRLGARLITWMTCLILLLSQPFEAKPADLYAQATSTMLDRSFPSSRVEYLLLDLRNGQTIAFRWMHAEVPIPVGSLLKPFVALAYSRLHSEASPSGVSGVFPVVRCHGKSDGCWRTGGHGSLGLERALAESCNAYFLALARELSASRSGMDAIDQISASYGLPGRGSGPSLDQGLPEQQMARILIGVTPEWRMPPIAIAHAYATLAAQSNNAVVDRILSGMKMAALRDGTAMKIGQHRGGVLAKTGTAPCVPDLDSNASRCIANGDGLVVVLAPAENPRVLLLVRERGTTGAHAAELAGRMLSRLEDSYASAR